MREEAVKPGWSWAETETVKAPVLEVWRVRRKTR